MLKTARQQAINLDLKRYYTGKPCKYGHVSERRTCDGSCIQCGINLYEQNKEKIFEQSRNWKIENQERRREIARNWARRNPQSAKQWVDKNIERKREISRDWIKNNPQSANANTNVYRHRKNNASPPWLDNNEIYLKYANCLNGYHVDHIVPIKGITPQGYLVSGLNVPWNLQYLTESENVTKRNQMTSRCYEIAISLRK